MVPVSVVIITHNEAEAIVSCVKACKLISDDIVVIDNDSTDGTPAIAALAGCRVYSEHWDGYGANKNKGIKYARYDWILSIDADEAPDMELVRSLHETDLSDPLTVFDIRFISYYGKKAIRFGSWGWDHHIRLFNCKVIKWDEPYVHESLVLPPAIQVKRLKGHIHHYSVKDENEGRQKTLYYARLSAGKYYQAGKKASFAKLYLAPLFHFIKNYILYLGLLDGKRGFDIACMISRHTHLKYRMLQTVNKYQYIEVPREQESLMVEYDM
jgi:glycosyltransferase involved in cell wall biosynthesis